MPFFSIDYCPSGHMDIYIIRYSSYLLMQHMTAEPNNAFGIKIPRKAWMHCETI